MAKVKHRRYQVIHPHLLGLKGKYRKVFIFHETTGGYKLNVHKKDYVGFPKQIIENNPELYERIEDDY